MQFFWKKNSLQISNLMAYNHLPITLSEITWRPFTFPPPSSQSDTLRNFTVKWFELQIKNQAWGQLSFYENYTIPSSGLYFKLRAYCYQRLTEMNKLILCGWVLIRKTWCYLGSPQKAASELLCVLTVRVPGGSLPLRDPFPSHSASDLWPGSGGGGAREEPSQHLGQHGGGLLRPQLHSRGLGPAEEAHRAAGGAGGESEEEAEDNAAEVSAAGETAEEAEGDMWDIEDRSQAAGSI